MRFRMRSSIPLPGPFYVSFGGKRRRSKRSSGPGLVETLAARADARKAREKIWDNHRAACGNWIQQASFDRERLRHDPKFIPSREQSEQIARMEAHVAAERDAEQARLKAAAERRRKESAEAAKAAALRAEHITAWNNSITTMSDVRRAAWRAINELS